MTSEIDRLRWKLQQEKDENARLRYALLERETRDENLVASFDDIRATVNERLRAHAALTERAEKAEANAARLAEALRVLRVDANRVCDKLHGENRSGDSTYYADLRRALDVAIAALAAHDADVKGGGT